MKKLLLIGNRPLEESHSVNEYDMVIRVNRMTNYEQTTGKTDLWLADIYPTCKELYDQVPVERYINIPNIIVFKHNYSLTTNYLKNCTGNIKCVEFTSLPISKYIPQYESSKRGFNITNSAWMLIYCLENFSNYLIYTLGMSQRTYLNNPVHSAHNKIYTAEEILYQSLILNNKIIPLDSNDYCVSNLEIKYTGKIPLFSSFWHNESDTLPDLVVASINSFIKNKCPYNLYTYKSYTNVPEGCVVKDANEIVPFSEFYIGSRNDICSFSDMFRIELVNKVDTAWTDTDNFFITDDFPTKDVLIIQDGKIQNSFFYLGETVKAKLFKMLLKLFYENPSKILYYDNIEMKQAKRELLDYRDKKDLLSHAKWGIGGSCLFTNIQEYVKLNTCIYDYYKYFNAFHYNNQHLLWCEKEAPYMSYLNNNVKILVMSLNLLDRGDVTTINSESYMSNLINKYVENNNHSS